MYVDFLNNDRNNSESIANNKLLQYFSDRFLEHGLTNSNFGLPEPKSQKTELEIMKLRYDPNQQQKLYEDLMTVFEPTKHEQLPFLEKVFKAINEKQTLRIILQGIIRYLYKFIIYP